jgi:type VI secretion system FHA domain protein
MTLTLRIENYDVLQDGGPTSVSVTGKSLHVGRSPNMDWTLPDPERHVSSHHFDIDYVDNAYYLTDKSTNGVFLQGQRHRIEGAHRLVNGERFQVGHYFIVVTIEGAAPAASARQMAPQPAPMAPPAPAFDDNADPWSMNVAPVAPIDVSPRRDPRSFEDFSGEFIVNPNPPPAAPYPQPVQAPQGSPFSPTPAASPSPFGASASPFSATPSPVVPAQPAHQAPQSHQAPMVGAASAQAVVAAFCQGAGLPPTSAAGVDAVALAGELGRTMRVAAQEMMALLQDRASTKKFTKGGERTMMGAAQNNPLKFLPDAAQALEVMFLKPRDGFMKGGEGMNAAFGDVRLHQMAVFAAIQPALIKLMSDLAPESIEEGTSGGLLGGGGKRKAWETYVERWDAKVAKHENGMLDVFLSYFAESYAAAVAAARKR